MRRNRQQRFRRGLKTALVIFAVLALMLITSSGFFTGRHGATEPAEDLGPAESAAPPSEAPGGDENAPGSAPPEESAAPEDGADGEGGDDAEESGHPKPTPTPNDCGMLVPESEAVDDSYFDDAVFIGNSRTEGLKMYSGLTNATFITEVGLTVDSIFTDYCDISGGGKARAFDQLAGMEFSKVYIMLGMNELGWVYESKYAEGYGRLIDVIQQSHPDAEIYVQSIIPVSKWLDSNPEQNRGYNTMANVIRLQKALVEMVKGKEGVHYVNVAECMEDSQGYLFSDSTQDGLHLNSEYCKKSEAKRS